MSVEMKPESASEQVWWDFGYAKGRADEQDEALEAIKVYHDVAEKAEAVLAKVREWAEENFILIPNEADRSGLVMAQREVLAILDREGASTRASD